MNYYKILNVSTKADDKTIKKAYRLLAKKYHPDMYQGDKAYAEDRMQEINEAYDTLSNPDLRREYDKSIGLYEEPEVNNSYSATKARNTNSYSNTKTYNNVKYRPNNANTYYDSYGYAETNYSTYTGERYTRNKYEERIKLDRKEVTIKICVLLVIASIILIGLINMVINSISELMNPGQIGNSKTNNLRENYYSGNANYKSNYTNSTSKSNNEMNNFTEKSIAPEGVNPSPSTNITLDKATEEWLKELEKIDINEEEVEEKINELIEAIEKYKKEYSN